MLVPIQFHIHHEYGVANRPLVYAIVSTLALCLDYAKLSPTVHYILIHFILFDVGFFLGLLHAKRPNAPLNAESAVALIGLKLVPALVAWSFYETTVLCKIALFVTNWYYLPFAVVAFLRAFVYGDLLDLHLCWFGLFSYCQTTRAYAVFPTASTSTSAQAA